MNKNEAAAPAQVSKLAKSVIQPRRRISAAGMALVILGSVAIPLIACMVFGGRGHAEVSYDSMISRTIVLMNEEIHRINDRISRIQEYSTVDPVSTAPVEQWEY